MEELEERLSTIECKARVFHAAMYSLGGSGTGGQSEIEAKAFQQFAKEICSELADIRKDLKESWSLTPKGTDVGRGERPAPDLRGNIFSYLTAPESSAE